LFDVRFLLAIQPIRIPNAPHQSAQKLLIARAGVEERAIERIAALASRVVA
jgi:hypothetical protein